VKPANTRRSPSAGASVLILDDSIGAISWLPPTLDLCADTHVGVSTPLCTLQRAGSTPNNTDRLWVTFNSASKTHIEWLRERLRALAKWNGYLHTARREGRHDHHTLRYGKACAIQLLREFYRDAGAPRLVRKWRIWDEYVTRNLSAEGGI
jgi:hypothetical protein